MGFQRRIKLDEALKCSKINVKDMIALDIGASTAVLPMSYLRMVQKRFMPLMSGTVSLPTALELTRGLLF